MSSQRQSDENAGRAPVLALRSLSAVRGGKRTFELRELELRRGELCALVGPNGAGKSTLLLCLAGLLPYQGSVQVDGGRGPSELRTIPDRTRARLVSFLGHSQPLAFSYTVRDVVSLSRAPYQDASMRASKADADATDEALRTWDLERFAERPASELSAGETRRVELASIFAQHTPLVLLDEPTTAMDFRQSREAHERLLERAKSGTSFLFSTHDLAEARRCATRAIVLAHGGIAADGKPSEVLDEKNLAAHFE